MTGKLVCGRACGPEQTMAAGGFSVLRFHLAPGYRLARHAHDMGGYVLCLEGQYRATASGRERSLSPGDFMIIGAGVEHEERADVSTHCLIVVPDPEEGAFAEAVHRRMRGLALFDRCVDYADLYRLWFELLVDDDASPSEVAYVSAEIAQGWLCKRPARRSAPPWLDLAEKRLRYRFAERHVVLHTAEALNVSVEHLVRSFRTRFGVTPGQFVRFRRMTAALRALLESDAPIAQVALDAGFTDQSHLTRSFRLMLRSTPNRYRRSSHERGRRLETGGGST